jgi:cation transport regulator
MPYERIADLPEDQVDQYNEEQKKAFLEACNNAMEQFGGDEERAMAVAHAAAKGTPGDR